MTTHTLSHLRKRTEFKNIQEQPNTKQRLFTHMDTEEHTQITSVVKEEERDQPVCFMLLIHEEDSWVSLYEITCTSFWCDKVTGALKKSYEETPPYASASHNHVVLVDFIMNELYVVTLPHHTTQP